MASMLCQVLRPKRSENVERKPPVPLHILEVHEFDSQSHYQYNECTRVFDLRGMIIEWSTSEDNEDDGTAKR